MAHSLLFYHAKGNTRGGLASLAVIRHRSPTSLSHHFPRPLTIPKEVIRRPLRPLQQQQNPGTGPISRRPQLIHTQHATSPLSTLPTPLRQRLPSQASRRFLSPPSLQPKGDPSEPLLLLRGIITWPQTLPRPIPGQWQTTLSPTTLILRRRTHRPQRSPILLRVER